MKILKRNPNDRATLAQLEEHAWLKSQPVSRIQRMNTTSPQQTQGNDSSEKNRYKGII
jgi:serine/threonine protein kinase